MPGAGWSNASSPGFSGAGACWSAGSSILKTFSVSFNSLAYLSSSGNFEIGSSNGMGKGRSRLPRGWAHAPRHNADVRGTDDDQGRTKFRLLAVFVTAFAAIPGGSH